MSRLPSPLKRAATSVVIAALLMAQAQLAAAQPRRGIFGVTVAISGDGLFNPVIRSVRITQVQSGMPAAAAGVSAGDQVIEVDGRRVVGSTAKDLAPLAQGKRVGETVKLLLKRSDGQLYRVSMVAVESSH
jgi:C-terminal processing protease CtpA/Prc